MTDSKRQLTEAALLQATSDLVLEASHEDLIAALGEDGYAEAVERSRVAAARALEQVAQTKVALHDGLEALLQLLKRQSRLSDHQVAQQAGIEEQELQRIEAIPGYQPSPRTISRLERFFDLPARSIAALTGAVKVERDGFAEGVVQFAAKSAALGKLTREERKHLNEFVKLLESYTDGDE